MLLSRSARPVTSQFLKNLISPNSSNTVLATLATYSNLNANSTYVLKTFDLTAFRGQTIRVYFLGTEDSSLQTSFVIDDTAVNTQ